MAGEPGCGDPYPLLHLPQVAPAETLLLLAPVQALLLLLPLLLLQAHLQESQPARLPPPGLQHQHPAVLVPRRPGQALQAAVLALQPAHQHLLPALQLTCVVACSPVRISAEPT